MHHQLLELQPSEQKNVLICQGGEIKTMECLSFVCLGYHAGQVPMPLRVVLVKTPGGKNAAETFF
jgi:hypothetical protein